MPRFAASLLAAALALSLAGCASTSPRPLDLSTLPQGDIPLARVTVMVRDDVDTDGRGAEFITRFFPAEMDGIQNQLAIASGMTLDVTEFLAAAAAGTLAVEMETLDFGGKVDINKYDWKASPSPSPRAGITLVFSPNEDGSLTLSVQIERDDPSYKHGYAAVIEIRIKPASTPI